MHELRPGLWHWHAPEGVTQEQVVERLRRPLLALPVEHALPTHGSPTDRGELERVLA